MSEMEMVSKFCQLLDRLIINDKRIIDCLTALARDYPSLSIDFAFNWESRFYGIREPARLLLFLYAADSLCFNLPYMRTCLTQKIAKAYDHAFRYSDQIIKENLAKLLEAWYVQNRFPREVLDEMRFRMAPPPPPVQSPLHTDNASALFNLESLTDWLSLHSTTPEDLQVQASGLEVPPLFSKLLANERSKIELTQLQRKLATDHRDVHKLVYELYDELSKHCLICGHRFSLDSELEKHLDWHFKINNRKGPMQAWLPNASSWIEPKMSLGQTEEEEQDEKKEETVYWAPCNPEQLRCLMCGEEFDIEPTEIGWVCKDSVRTFIQDQNREVVLHMACIQSIPDVESFQEEPSIEADSLSNCES